MGAAVSFVRTGLYRIPTSGWAQSDTTEPLAHFPPGFSTAIAAPIALGVAPVQAARIVIAISAFVTAAATLLLMDAAWSGTLAVLVLFLTPAVVDVHLSVLSEPLFIALLVSTLLTMVRVAERPAWAWRLVLGLLAAAALMVRYAGAGVVAAAALWVLAQPAPWRRRFRDTTIVSLPTLGVLGVWVTHAIRRAGSTGIRRFATYGHFGATLRMGVSTMADWLAPGVSHPVWLRWTIAIVVALVAAGVLAKAARGARLIIGAAATLIICSAIVVIASRLLADPNIPFDERILAPTIVLVELATVAALAQSKWPVRAVLGAWFVGSAIVSLGAVHAALEDGNDFASADWRFSPTIAWVHDSAAGRALYTNWPVALYFHAGRNAHGLPPILEPLTLRRFGDRLARVHGLMVAFNTPSPDAAPPDSIAARLRLQPVARLSDGTVWEVPTSADGRPRAASGSP